MSASDHAPRHLSARVADWARWALGIGFMGRLLSGLVLLNLLVVALAMWALHESRVKYDESASAEVQNLARLLGRDIAAGMRALDLALQATAQEAEQRMAKGSAEPPSMNLYIERQLFQNPDLDGLRVADAQGRLMYGTGVTPDSDLTVADRDYFVRLQRDPAAGFVVAQPVLGRISNKWVLNLARAVRGPDGRFAGVVVGSVPLARFTSAFEALALGVGGSFTLFDDEMRVVTRYPGVQGVGNPVGMRFGSPTLKILVQSGVMDGSYQAVSTIDGVPRVFGYHRVRGTPLHIVVGLASEDYLAGWRQEVFKAVVLLTIIALLTVVLSWFIYRVWHRQADAVAALREANQTLAAEKQLNQTIIQSSPFAIYTRDRDGIVTAWNRAAEQLFGWRSEEILGKPLLSVPADRERETAELRERVLRGENIIQFEVQRQRRDGSVFDLSTTLAPLRDASGAIDGYLAIAADITERKAAEKRIEFLAYRDVLTGLPNRQLLLDRFTQAAAHADRTGSQMALLFLDLDNFKTINDSLGHAVGDALLKEIADRLATCVRETDTISRQGGDEFLVVLPDLRGVDVITPVLQKIRDRLHLPFEFEGHELATSASIGIAIYPDDGKDFDTLLKKADTAMYQAKDAGRNNYRFFDEHMNIRAVEHMQLKSGLRHAIERGEFELHYQPQIDLATGEVIGAEALLRWKHPEQGLISPARFIPVAEDSGLIVPIGEWVIHEACRQGVAWRQAGLSGIVMAVNLSAVEFKRGDVEHKVMRALQDSGLDPHLLELELTESVMVHNTEQVLATVQRLKRLGVTLSIDDFGTGYSSLSYLKRFEVDKLKIDQTFIRDLAFEQGDAAIIRAIIQMARSLNLRTLAEGVEDAGILARLRVFGCDEAQGYYFARPMPATAFAAFVTQWSSREALTEGEWII